MEEQQTVNQSAEQVETVSTEQQVGKEVKTFTEEEVIKMIQREADKRTNQALDKAKAKWEAEYQEKLSKEKSEAERLAKMTESERKAEEFKKLQEGFDSERAKFEQERHGFEMERLKHTLTKELNTLDIPIKFADFLLGSDAETTKTNLDTFSQMWKETLQSEIEKHVEQRLKGNPPKQATSGNGELANMTRSEFGKLPYNERVKLMKENPELVKEILARK